MWYNNLNSVWSRLHRDCGNHDRDSDHCHHDIQLEVHVTVSQVRAFCHVELFFKSTNQCFSIMWGETARKICRARTTACQW